MTTRFIGPVFCVAFVLGCGQSTPVPSPTAAAPKQASTGPGAPAEPAAVAPPKCEPVRWCGARQDVKRISDVLKPASLGCPPQIAGAEIPEVDRESVYLDLKLGASAIAKFDESATASKRAEGNAIDCCYARSCDDGS